MSPPGVVKLQTCKKTYRLPRIFIERCRPISATVSFQSLESSEANLFWAQRACKSEPLLLLHGSRRFYDFFGQRFLRGKLRNDDDVSDYARGSQRCLGRKDRTRPRIEKIATIGHDLKAVLISFGI